MNSRLYTYIKGEWKNILLLLVSLSLLVFLLIVTDISNINLSKYADMQKAQVVQISLTVQPLPLLIIDGDIIEPLGTQVFQFGPGGGSFTFGPSSVTITFPPGLLTAVIDFFGSWYSKNSIIALRPLPTSLNLVGNIFYDFSAFEGFVQKITFDGNFSMKFTYTDAEIAGLEEVTIKPYFFNETESAWELLNNFTRDQANNSITVLTDHLTLFAIFGERKEVVGGGGAILFGLPPTEPQPEAQILTAEAKKSDLNSDGKVGLIDFATMIFHWGSRERPKADINEDGIVDLVDYGMLILHWTA